MTNKLNLGCGPKWKEQYPDYDGLDIINYGQKYYCDVRNWEPEVKYDQVIANHFIEHFDQEELRGVFNAVHYALNPNGKFKFVVPHMKKERAWILSHKTFWNETTANWLGEIEARDVYGFGHWRVVEVITNEREDLHVTLEAIK